MSAEYFLTADSIKLRAQRVSAFTGLVVLSQHSSILQFKSFFQRIYILNTQLHVHVAELPAVMQFIAMIFHFPPVQVGGGCKLQDVEYLSSQVSNKARRQSPIRNPHLISAPLYVRLTSATGARYGAGNVIGRMRARRPG